VKFTLSVKIEIHPETDILCPYCGQRTYPPKDLIKDENIKALYIYCEACGLEITLERR